jgi:hypothetical protein
MLHWGFTRLNVGGKSLSLLKLWFAQNLSYFLKKDDLENGKKYLIYQLSTKNSLGTGTKPL